MQKMKNIEIKKAAHMRKATTANLKSLAKDYKSYEPLDTEPTPETGFTDSVLNTNLNMLHNAIDNLDNTMIYLKNKLEPIMVPDYSEKDVNVKSDSEPVTSFAVSQIRFAHNKIDNLNIFINSVINRLDI